MTVTYELPHAARAPARERVESGRSETSPRQVPAPPHSRRSTRCASAHPVPPPRLFRHRPLPHRGATPAPWLVDGRAANQLRPSGFYVEVGKPLLDRILAAVLLVGLAPVMGVAAALLRRQLDPGGVVFRQRRVGQGGVDFDMLKLRTMRQETPGPSVPGAGDGHAWDCPVHRIVPVGRALRRLSIDELPQLINVVRGDMSLVGPRPEVSTIADALGLRDHPRHWVRPGMTGAWQISARRREPLYQAVDEDLHYVAGVSLSTDVRILAATVGAVVRRCTD